MQKNVLLKVFGRKEFLYAAYANSVIMCALIRSLKGEFAFAKSLAARESMAEKFPKKQVVKRKADMPSCSLPAAAKTSLIKNKKGICSNIADPRKFWSG